MTYNAVMGTEHIYLSVAVCFLYCHSFFPYGDTRPSPTLFAIPGQRRMSIDGYFTSSAWVITCGMVNFYISQRLKT